MSNRLFLESLVIYHFRAFSSLTIKRLGRVNLIVGKNNVGKSSLLEALWLYANQGHLEIVWKILEARNEGRRPERITQAETPIGEIEQIDVCHDAIKQLFYQGANSNQQNYANIGPIGPDHTILTLKLGLKPDQHTGHDVPAFKTEIGRHKHADRVDVASNRWDWKGGSEQCVMVAANGLDAKTIERFWDKVVLTSLEDDVLNALRLIASKVDRVSLVASRNGLLRRTPVAKVDGLADPIPLRRLGEGMNRLFGIALALVNAKDGMLLIDEIESGLHYSVQPDVWRLVFEVARRLNIQVFATTHSWDCLTAFQEAAKSYEQDEGVLIRLVEKKGQIVADLFDEDDLSVVAREGIEVR